MTSQATGPSGRWKIASGELERQLGRKTLEVEILEEVLDKSRSKKLTWHVQSQPKGGSR